MIGEPDEFEQFVRIGGIVVVGGRESQGLGRAHASGDSAVLQHHADVGNESPVVGDGIEPEHPHRSGGRASVALERLDRGGLPGAIRAEQCGDASRFGGERQPVDRDPVAVADDQIADLDGG